MAITLELATDVASGRIGERAALNRLNGIQPKRLPRTGTPKGRKRTASNGTVPARRITERQEWESLCSADNLSAAQLERRDALTQRIAEYWENHPKLIDDTDPDEKKVFLGVDKEGKPKYGVRVRGERISQFAIQQNHARRHRSRPHRDLLTTFDRVVKGAACLSIATKAIDNARPLRGYASLRDWLANTGVEYNYSASDTPACASYGRGYKLPPTNCKSPHPVQSCRALCDIADNAPITAQGWKLFKLHRKHNTLPVPSFCDDGKQMPASLPHALQPSTLPNLPLAQPQLWAGLPIVYPTLLDQIAHGDATLLWRIKQPIASIVRGHKRIGILPEEAVAISTHSLRSL
jgi:hypothetical protein